MAISKVTQVITVKLCHNKQVIYLWQVPVNWTISLEKHNLSKLKIIYILDSNFKSQHQINFHLYVIVQKILANFDM